MQEYLQAVDLIDFCIQNFMDSLENPRTALEVFNHLKNIQQAIHPKMEEARVWNAVYILMKGDKLRRSRQRTQDDEYLPNIHPKNKQWVFEYLRQLSRNETVL